MGQGARESRAHHRQLQERHVRLGVCMTDDRHRVHDKDKNKPPPKSKQKVHKEKRDDEWRNASFPLSCCIYCGCVYACMRL